MIVVGLRNTDRNRDMIPATVSHRPGSGGADKFLAFIREELIPYIRGQYRTKDFSALYGMSNSALFTVYALLQAPETFNAYIASSPMIGHCPEVLMGLAADFKKKEIASKRILYMIYGTEDSRRVTDYIPDFFEYVKSDAPEHFIGESVILEGEGHVPPSSLTRGLRYIFEAGDQQTASTIEPPRTVDMDFFFPNPNPAFPLGEGPVILIDEAHNNFHTAHTTYLPFARLLTEDGYVVKRGLDRIFAPLPDDVCIYVIADAQPPNKKTDPPTFDPREVQTLADWVNNGGSCFIITDHMPDPGAVAELAAAFDISVNNGYAFTGPPPGPAEPLIFKKSDGTLAEHPLTSAGRTGAAVKRIATFAGSAFQASQEFEPLLIFRKGVRAWMPEEYWTFPQGTPHIDVAGWYQGGIREFGKGRIAFFSEAAMFTAQVFGGGKVKAGMNHPQGADNAPFLLNIIHWLSRVE